MAQASITKTAEGIKLTGVIDLNNLMELRHQGEAIIKQATTETIKLSLNDIKSDSSFSLSLILCWMRYATKQNKVLSISELPPAIENLSILYNLKGIL